MATAKVTAGENVRVTFKTKYHVADDDYVIGLIGSHDILGQWDPKRCLLLNQCIKPEFWSLDVMLPVRSVIYWKLIYLDKNTRHVIYWEKVNNRRLNVYRKSVVIVGWNDDVMIKYPDLFSNAMEWNSNLGKSAEIRLHNINDQIVNVQRDPQDRANSNEVVVQFGIMFGVVEEWQAFAIVGSHENLGSWDPRYCVIMQQVQHCDPEKTNWFIKVKLPKHTDINFKLVFIDKYTRHVIFWNKFPDRLLNMKTDTTVLLGWDDPAFLQHPELIEIRKDDGRNGDAFGPASNWQLYKYNLKERQNGFGEYDDNESQNNVAKRDPCLSSVGQSSTHGGAAVSLAVAGSFVNSYGEYEYIYADPTLNNTGSDLIDLPTIYLTGTSESLKAEYAENRTIAMSRVKRLRSSIYGSVTRIARKLRDIFLDVICGLINHESGSGSVVVGSVMVAVVTATVIYHILQCF